MVIIGKQIEADVAYSGVFSSIDIDATYEDWYKIYNVNTSLQPFT